MLAVELCERWLNRGTASQREVKLFYDYRLLRNMRARYSGFDPGSGLDSRGSPRIGVRGRPRRSGLFSTGRGRRKQSGMDPGSKPEHFVEESDNHL